ncbi:hypothetical protein LCGC14_2714740 [marine sediment metagenome]|uniref:DUF4326 domain-containing protein n=1 Tax=marine sediment metagenome TaxID=412755 RepID=A0A0F9C3K7_9ZZZZ
MPTDDSSKPSFDELMTPLTFVVHCKLESYDIYIGRPSKWGNPFIIGRDGDRHECLAKYANWLNKQPELKAAVSELKGKILGCWCAPFNLCHGDILARLADAT